MFCSALLCESMVINKTTDSSSKLRKQHGEPAKDSGGSLLMKIYQMRKQIQEERVLSVKEKLQRNGENLQCQVSALRSVISERDSSHAKKNTTSQMLSSRINHPVSKLLGFAALSQCSGDKDHINNQDVSPTPAPTIKIPFIERLPPYTTWMHLARNEKMGEDQSIVGRRRIYYEKHGGEALICSDSDEEGTETEEVKHEFSEGEDRLLWMAFEEHGFSEEVLNSVRQFVGGTRKEIQERYENLKRKNMGRLDQHSEDSGDESHIGICLDKSLSAALDSFDNLFCRRCIQLFDCPLHGFSQPLIYPSEKQPAWSEPEGDKKPCGDRCYLLDGKMSENSTPGSFQSKKTATVKVDGILAPSSAEEHINRRTEAISQEERCSTMEVDCCEDLNVNVHVSESVGKRKVTNHSDSALHESILPPDDSQYSSKKMKIISDDLVTGSGDYSRDLNLDSCGEEKHTSTSAPLKSSVEHTSHKLIVPGSICHGEHDKDVGDGQEDDTNETELKKLYNSMVGQVDEKLSFSDWKPLEKELYLKGVEMFGRNSCLIARNLLSGLKTCMEVASYMSMPQVHGPVFIVDENGRIISSCTDQKMSTARMLRKRGKTRKLKYSFKSAGIPSAWKKIAHGKNKSCNQYTPCECQGTCGKQCPCHINETFCEKYCGCSKLCKYRFRGCHCAKSQCRSRQCPCFAAGRECDPDVCRNCWISCGDGSLGEPPRRGDGQCGNMRLLLRERQRILFAKSDVAGWGAFIKNPVNKNDYLGEYTGELVSHREADKRGKLYDRANSSFLFNLNDQLVLDAYRKGDKLKFANHSYSANCYAKVVMVAGDHRVGIFANEHIDAGEELFYDYRYAADHTPHWARKLEGYKRDESVASQGRAKKHQSH